MFVAKLPRHPVPMSSKTVKLPDDPLVNRLRMAQRSDLDDLLRDLKLEAERHRQKSNEELVCLISASLRSAAGNSIMNLRRGRHDFPYKQILIDVADKLHPSKIRWTPFKLHDDSTVEQIESYVYERVQARISQWLEEMCPEKREDLARRIEDEMRRKGYPEALIRTTLAGILTGSLSGALLAGVVAPLLMGSLWTALFGFSLAQLLIGGVAVGGPVAMVIGAGTLLTSPSYSKTIPAVYRLIQIRLSAEEREKL